MKHPISTKLALLTLLITLIWAPTTAAQGKTITSLVGEDERFSTLAELLTTSGLATTLNQTNDAYTMFAPTNDAFAKLPASELASLRKDANRLLSILSYHTVRGRTTGNGIAVLKAIPTLHGNNIRVSLNDGNAILDGRAQVIETDLTATNGVVHAIDTVLIPTTTATAVTTTTTATAILPNSGAPHSTLPTLIAAMAGGLLILLGLLFALRRR